MNTRSITLLSSVAAALALVLPAIAGAAPTIDISLTAQPVRYDVRFAPYRFTGLGRAAIGMTVDQVRGTVASDHPGATSTLATDAATGRQVLTVVAPDVAPGPGRATINFVFGAPDARLIAVNVAWTTEGPAATPAQRAALVAAARRVAEDNAGFTWPPLASVRGQVLPDGALIVFAGTTAAGGGIEIRLDGVEVDIEPRARTATSPAVPRTHRPARHGPARLLVAYVGDAVASAAPDDRLPDGSF